MEAAQKERLAALLAEVQVAILVTQGEQWPTATMQAFAETPEFDLLFIMNDATEKFQNLLKHPYVTCTWTRAKRARSRRLRSRAC